MKPTSALIVVNSLDPDGAQRQLVEILKHGKLKYYVLLILWRGRLLHDLERLENVELLGLFSFRRLFGLLLKDQPLVCGWMYHANVVAFLIAFLFRRRLVVSIHHDFQSLELKPFKFKLSFALNRLVSKYAKAVHYPSKKARDSHLAEGFPEANSFVLPNSLFERFTSEPMCSSVFKPIDRDPSLLFLGRNHPDKGTALFYDVVEKVIAANAEVRATVVGSGHVPELLAARYPSAVEHTSFMGHTEIDCDFLGSFDLLLVTSPAEAFSLVLLEASACGLQFVSTDVGIARDLADRGLGWIASADADAFSEQVLTALAMVGNTDDSSKEAQMRYIRADYDAEVVSHGFEDVLRRIDGTTP